MTNSSLYIMYIKEELARILQNWPDFKSSNRKLLKWAKSVLSAVWQSLYSINFALWFEGTYHCHNRYQVFHLLQYQSIFPWLLLAKSAAFLIWNLLRILNSYTLCKIWQICDKKSKDFKNFSTVVFGFKHVRFKEVFWFIMKISLLPKWKSRLNDVWFREDFRFKEDFCWFQKLSWI